MTNNQGVLGVEVSTGVETFDLGLGRDWGMRVAADRVFNY